MVTPSLVMVGAEFLVEDDVSPFGPSVTLTVLASLSHRADARARPRQQQLLGHETSLLLALSAASPWAGRLWHAIESANW
jgi:hypothetical protein